MHRHRWMLFRVGFTYIGTVVGAGFASGQEVLRFFTAYGPNAVWGVVLATALLCLGGIFIMETGATAAASSHHGLLVHLGGRRLGRTAGYILTIFLFGGLTVMLAGGGAVAKEQWALPAAAGALITAFLTLITVLAGLDGIMNANSVIVPILIVAVLGLAGHTIAHHRPEFGGLWQPAPALQPAVAPHWTVAAIIYSGYNLMLSLPVLGPLGFAVGDYRILRQGGLIGGIGLGVLALAMHIALQLKMPAAGHQQVPMLYLIKEHGAAVQVGYSLVLWAEIYSTAIAAAFGLGRTIMPGGTGPKYRLGVLISMAGALLCSRLGFGSLVGTLYPILGYAAAGLLLAAAFQRYGFTRR